MEVLNLHSPFGGEELRLCVSQESCESPRTLNGIKLVCADDVLTTIRLVLTDFPELTCALQDTLNDVEFDHNDIGNLKMLCQKFNAVVNILVSLRKGTTLSKELFIKKGSDELIKHIIQSTYYGTINEPERLNQYEPFSPEVYGETSVEFLFDILEQVEVEEDDVFLDLGSGVGQVVLQVAASTNCHFAIGIEKEKVRAEYAVQMSANFEKWMNWFGKPYSSYQLLEGDFLAEDFRETLFQSTIIFVNNFAFGPLIDQSLKSIFAELPDGVKIITSKALCPLNFRVTERNLGDIGSILRVTEIPGNPGSVSWTNNPIKYYLHVIDRRNLEDYFLVKPPQMLSNSSIARAPKTSPVKSHRRASDASHKSLKEREDTKSWSLTRYNLRKASSINSPSGCYEYEDTSSDVEVRKQVTKRHKKHSSRSSYRSRIPVKIEQAFKVFQSTQKQELYNYLQLMASPEYAHFVQLQIREAKEINQALKQSKLKLETQIEQLNTQGVALVEARCREIGLNHLDSSYSIINYGIELLAQHVKLQFKKQSLAEQVVELTKMTTQNFIYDPHSLEGEQIEGACDVLKRFLEALEPRLLLDKFAPQIARTLIHPEDKVRVLGLKQLQRCAEDPTVAPFFAVKHVKLIEAAAGCLFQEDLGVAQAAHKFFTSLGRHHATLHAILKSLSETSRPPSEVNNFREYQVLIELGVQSEKALSMIESAKSLESLLRLLASSDDPLSTVAAIEEITKLAMTKHGLEFLRRAGVLHVLVEQVQVQRSPLSSLVLPGLLKFFGQVGGAFPDHLLRLHPGLAYSIFGLIDSDDLSISVAALEAIGLIASTVAGKAILLNYEEKYMQYTMERLREGAAQFPTEYRVRCLITIQNIVSVIEGEQDNRLSSVTKSWFSYLGDGVLDMLTKVIRSPFEDLKLAALGVVKGIAALSWGQDLLANEQQLINYLLNRTSESTIEGLHSKYNVLQAIAMSGVVTKHFPEFVARQILDYVEQGPIFVPKTVEVAFERDQ